MDVNAVAYKYVYHMNFVPIPTRLSIALQQVRTLAPSLTT